MNTVEDYRDIAKEDTHVILWRNNYILYSGPMKLIPAKWFDEYVKDNNICLGSISLELL